MMLWKHICEALLAHPSQKVTEEAAEMTYEELLIFAEGYAERIASEKCCAILCHSEMAAAMSLLSCFAAGVTAVPLSLRYGAAHCRKILEVLSPTALITDLDGDLDVIRLEEPTYTQPKEHPALIMFTSGTTGIPKGAMLSERNILANVRDICDYLEVDESDTFLIARPLYHAAVLNGEFLTALFKGATVRFYSESFQPAAVLSLIERFGATVFCGTPTLLSLMERFYRKNTRLPLKTLCISGECMSGTVGKRIAAAFPGVNIYHIYGLTEASPRVSYLPPGLFQKYPDSVGIPLASVRIRIVKDNGQTAALGEEGLLYVKGPNVMLGYYNAKEATARVLRDGWLCTGDIALLTEEGLLRIKGRSDDMIIRAGMNIYPQEIEGRMKADERVKEILVYPFESPALGVGIGMKVAGDFKNVEQVKRLCAELLPTYEIPNKIELVEELAHNGSGKLKRKQ